MLRNAKANTLLVAALLLTGCAHSDRRTSQSQMRYGGMNNRGSTPAPNILPETYFAAGQLFEAQGLLDGYHEAVTEGENYDTIIKRVDLKIGLNNALFAIQRDLRHVKTALALVT